MVIVQICVGSSCYIKRASKIVEMMQESIAAEHLEDDIALSGSFCTGKCNRVGVTVTVGDEIVTGITRENFREFWNDKVMSAVRADKGAV